MVCYRSDPVSNPNGRDAHKLKNYVAGNADRVITSAGIAATDRDLQLFAEYAATVDQQRMHTISFHDEHDLDDLADRAHQIGQQLDGAWMAGVHAPDSDRNPHIHIAEIGSYRDVNRGPNGIEQLREVIAEIFSEESPAWA